jgi:hypothetical protein
MALRLARWWRSLWQQPPRRDEVRYWIEWGRG